MINASVFRSASCAEQCIRNTCEECLYSRVQIGVIDGLVDVSLSIASSCLYYDR